MFGFLICWIYNFVLNYFFEKKIARNYVSATHAYSCVLVNGLYLLTNSNNLFILSKNITVSYFLYDTSYILVFENINLLNGCYIYHHISTIYLLYQPFLENILNKVIFLAEISNLPSYIVYYYLHVDKKYKNDLILRQSLSIQKILYCTIRVPVLTYMLYYIFTILDIYNIQHLISIIVAFPVYLMGLLWSCKLIKII